MAPNLKPLGCSDPMVADPLLAVKVVKSPQCLDIKGNEIQLSLQLAHKCAHLENVYPFFPCGRHKNPLIDDWTHREGLPIQECLVHQGCRAIGVRLSADLGCLDFDGESAIQFACDIGINPFKYPTWQIHRKNEFGRFKLLFKTTDSQKKELIRGEFQNKVKTKDPIGNEKGEALEIFLSHKRQVIVLGDHPDDDTYIWYDLGPDELMEFPDEVWEWVKKMERKSITSTRSSGKSRYHSSGDFKRLDVCPICGRNSNLWCGQKADGMISCMRGNTFDAELRHGPIRLMQVVNGYVCVKKRQDCLIFIPEGQKRRRSKSYA